MDESQATPEEIAQIEALIHETASAHSAALFRVLDLPVGGRIERTEQGFEVFIGLSHGVGRSLPRAFDSIGATYETREGKIVLVSANGAVLPPE